MAFRSRNSGVRFAQTVALVVAVWGLTLETEITRQPFGTPAPHAEVVFTGYPVYWHIDARNPDLDGLNPLVPACQVVAALCLPPVLVGWARRMPGRQAPAGASGRSRLAPAILSAALAGLAAAAVEGETFLWRGKFVRAATPFFTYPPGAWIGQSKSATDALDQASQFRWQHAALPLGKEGGELRWWFSTRLTAAGIILGGLTGLLVFKPHHRSAPGGAAVTTPPAAG